MRDGVKVGEQDGLDFGLPVDEDILVVEVGNDGSGGRDWIGTGLPVDPVVGRNVERDIGVPVGSRKEGELVGMRDGMSVGEKEGELVGTRDGVSVGE